MMMMMNKLLSFGLVLATAVNAIQHDCFSSNDLWIALGKALPGDDIVLHGGPDNLFQGHFYATEDATAEKPITIRSADPSNRATVRGLTIFSFDASLYVTGNYWIVEDLIVLNSNKGIVFDNAIGGTIRNCYVHSTGMYLHVCTYILTIYCCCCC